MLIIEVYQAGDGRWGYAPQPIPRAFVWEGEFETQEEAKEAAMAEAGACWLFHDEPGQSLIEVLEAQSDR